MAPLEPAATPVPPKNQPSWLVIKSIWARLKPWNVVLLQVCPPSVVRKSVTEALAMPDDEAVVVPTQAWEASRKSTTGCSDADLTPGGVTSCQCTPPSLVRIICC